MLPTVVGLQFNQVRLQQSYRKWTAARKVWMYPQATSVEHVRETSIVTLGTKSHARGFCFETMTVPASFAENTREHRSGK